MSAVTFTYGSWTPTIPPKIVIRCSVAPDSATLVSGRKTPKQIEEVWTVEGQFVGDDSDPQGSLLSQLAAAEAALHVHHSTIALSRSEGHIRRYSANDTIDGIIVEEVSLPQIDGAELATVLTWSATFRFRYAADPGSTAANRYVVEVENEDRHTTIEVSGSITDSDAGLSTAYSAFKAAIKTLLEVTHGGLRLMRERTIRPGDENRIDYRLQFDSKSPQVFGWRQTIEVQPSVYIGIPIPIVPGVQTNPAMDVPIIQIGGRSPGIGRDSGTCMGTTGYPQFPNSIFNPASNPYAAPPVKNKMNPKVGSNGEILGYPIEWSYTHYISPLILSPPDAYASSPFPNIPVELTP